MRGGLEQLIALRVIVGETISDTALLKDDALASFFDWEQIGHPSTHRRRLADMRWSHNLGLQGIVTGLSDCVLRAGRPLVAIDSTVVSAFGEKIEGAEEVVQTICRFFLGSASCAIALRPPRFALPTPDL